LALDCSNLTRWRSALDTSGYCFNTASKVRHAASRLQVERVAAFDQFARHGFAHDAQSDETDFHCKLPDYFVNYEIGSNHSDAERQTKLKTKCVVQLSV